MATIWFFLFFFLGYHPCRVDETQHPRDSVGKKGEIVADDSAKLQEECNWGNYARGALYALTSRGNKITQVRNVFSIICSVVQYVYIFLTNRKNDTNQKLPIKFANIIQVSMTYVVSVDTCLEKLWRNFLWNIVGEDSEFHLVNWDEVCNPI